MPRHVSSSPQLDLLGGNHPQPTHRLFLALLPGEAVARRIEAAAAAVAASQPLRARMVRPARYHLTLHFLGDSPMRREDVARAAMAAASQVRAEPFELVLDTASAFHGREPPCVLHCTESPAGLQALWKDLRLALVRAGVGGHLSPQFTPHVTYAYAHGALPPTVPIEPIAWWVDGFALLHSIVGGGAYQMLDAWRLQP